MFYSTGWSYTHISTSYLFYICTVTQMHFGVNMSSSVFHHHYVKKVSVIAVQSQTLFSSVYYTLLVTYRWTPMLVNLKLFFLDTSISKTMLVGLIAGRYDFDAAVSCLTSFCHKTPVKNIFSCMCYVCPLAVLCCVECHYSCV